jgi:putative pyoverdin transport system ATP-binding/permease protein
MKLIGLLIRASRGTLAFAIPTGVISGASSALLIALISSALNGGGPSRLTIALSFAGLAALTLFSNIASQILLNRLSQSAVYDLRVYLCERILSAPLRKMEEVGSARLFASLTDDVMVVANVLLSIPPFCINAATVAVCLVYLSWLAWKVLVALLVFMAFGVMIYQALVMQGVRSLRVAREDQDGLFKALRAQTEGFKELKLNRRRRAEFFDRAVKHTASSFREHNRTGMNFYIAAASWAQLLFYIFIGLLLFVIPLVNQVAPQTLMGYTLTILFIWGPLGSIINVFPMIGRAKIALNKIESLGLSLESHAEGDAAATDAPLIDWERIELSGVTHAYQDAGGDRSFALGPIDMTFRPGELVFLVGGNGSGKTTLAKLLTGLYAPDAGEICLDGRAITDGTREQYRQHFSAIFSDFYIFDSLLGLDAPDLDEQASLHLSRFHLDHKVKIEEGKFSTTALSQGQRKRLALLTSFLEDRRFYVFDEWAADQDPAFREMFYMQILPELKRRGKTVLAITHDDRYFRIADRVIKLEYGKLATIEEPAAQLGAIATAQSFNHSSVEIPQA